MPANSLNTIQSVISWNVNQREINTYYTNKC